MKEVTLEEMLSAREKRVERQNKFLALNTGTLICFTMNIPGPIKVSPLIEFGFTLGCKMLEEALGQYVALDQVKTAKYKEKTGLEAYYYLTANPLSIKNTTTALEDGSLLGRLFDIDVLNSSGQKISRSDLGLDCRLCLLCNESAAACGRSRKHSLAALSQHIEKVLEDSLLDYIATATEKALAEEVAATPKPGLVDKDNSGAHQDMDYTTFQKSIQALVPHFRLMAKEGYTFIGSEENLFLALRPMGAKAEKDMFKATGNVNTHKGIIFSLGIIVAFSLRYFKEYGTFNAKEILQLVANGTKNILAKDFDHIDKYHPHTHGEKLFVKYGYKGIRGEAMAGFPSVLNIGLPVLQNYLAKNPHANASTREKYAIQTLLELLRQVEDTNILIRTSPEMLHYASEKASEILALGGALTNQGIKAIWNLNKDFTEKNISPGGTADLLIVTLFLNYLEEL